MYGKEKHNYANTWKWDTWDSLATVNFCRMNKLAGQFAIRREMNLTSLILLYYVTSSS